MAKNKPRNASRVPADHPNGVQVHNEDIALGFDEMADLLALQDENPFRIRAYRRAAQVARRLPQELQQKIEQGFDPESLRTGGICTRRIVKCSFSRSCIVQCNCSM